MSLPPPDGYASWAATYLQVSSGRKAVVTCGCNPAPAATAAGTNANMGAAMFGAGELLDFTFLDDEWVIESTYVLLNTGGVLTSDVSLSGATGAVSFQSPPPNVSIVVNKRTALAGRQYRGRMAIPSGYLDIADMSDEGIIDPTVLSSWNTRAASTLGVATSAGVPLVLLHDVPLAGGPPPAPTPITSLVVSGLVGTQRRRLRR